jgi:hypothetical protein
MILLERGMFVKRNPLRHNAGFFMIPEQKRPSWFKSRGYLHLTPKINVYKRAEEIFSKVRNKKFVARHAFFPLIHSVIKERKFKKHPDEPGKRVHSYHDKKKDVHVKTAKNRPLHYATHIDSMIFGYYGEILLELYEKKLAEHEGLSECIIAYRKILDPSNTKETGKSTIHFANEAFNEIKNRSEDECVVLMFDIKSFFSEIDHQLLKKAWCDLLKTERLEKDHFNVFNAATNFSYILLNDLRISKNKNGRRNGFDEKKLAYIRRTTGKEAFFESEKDFRDAIKYKEITVFKHPFIKNNRPVGIPQGLPISAMLANLYLLDFDIKILDIIVKDQNCYYRRYSDDILIICKAENYQQIERLVLELIEESKLEISTNKTEVFLFKNMQISPKINRLTSIQILKDKKGNESVCRIGEKPLTYLGFEFHGYKTQIKSANQAKFYRRMIYAVKRRAKRVLSRANSNIEQSGGIFKGQIKRLYTHCNLDKTKFFTTRKYLARNVMGEFSYRIKRDKLNHKSNYFSYTRRAAEILKEPRITDVVVKKYKTIFHQALNRHFKK